MRIFCTSNPCLSVHLTINTYQTGTQPNIQFLMHHTFYIQIYFYRFVKWKFCRVRTGVHCKSPTGRLCVTLEIQFQCQESSLNWISVDSDWPLPSRCSIIAIAYHTNQTKPNQGWCDIVSIWLELDLVIHHSPVTNISKPLCDPKCQNQDNLLESQLSSPRLTRLSIHL